MAIIPSIINWLNVKRINQIELFKKYPYETQKETFYQLLAKAASTEWGKKYSYSSITFIKEYQSRFPVQTYEEIIPYVDRLRKGETNLLWPGEIKWFAKSSGTTSTKSKFIPMSREALEDCHYRAGKGYSYHLYYATTLIPGSFQEKALPLEEVIKSTSSAMIHYMVICQQY